MLVYRFSNTHALPVTSTLHSPSHRQNLTHTIHPHSQYLKALYKVDCYIVWSYHFFFPFSFIEKHMLKDHIHSNLAAILGMITQNPGNVSAHTKLS